MTTTSRNVGLLFLLAAVVGLPGFLSNRSGDGNSNRANATATQHSGLPGETTPHPGNPKATPPGPDDEAPPAPEKSSRSRPAADELARRRLESHRIEQIERIEEFKASGFGARHPNMVAATEKLRSIEAELAAGAPAK